MNLRLVQASLVLFIKYYIVGAFYITMGLVLGTHGMGPYIGSAFSVGGFTSLAVGMLMGEVADRFMPPNRLLFFTHLVSGTALLLIPAQIAAGHVVPFFALFAINTTFGDATIPVCSRVAFHAVKDSVREFAIARAFGVAGWMVAGLVTGFSGISASLMVFQVGALASFVMAIYVLFLPPTPSSGRTGSSSLGSLIGWDAFALMRERSFFVFMIVAVVIFIPMQAYNAYGPVYLRDSHVTNVGALLILSQIIEILLMFSLAYFLRVWGFRIILATACGAWAVILGLFALGNSLSLALIIVAILLRGVAWDFFYAASEVYLNSKSSEALKARGQALLRTASWGLGSIIGGVSSGWLYNTLWQKGEVGVSHWALFWGIFIILPVILVGVVLAFFREAEPVRHSKAADEVSVPLAIP